MDISLNKIFVAICLGAVFILLNNLRLVQYDIEQLKRFQHLKKFSYVLNLQQVLPKPQFNNVAEWYKDMLQQVNKPKKPSLKIYIYDLPKKFNKDIVSCLYPKSETVSTSYNGMGPELYRDQPLSIHASPKHSLEWLIHKKLFLSPYRTQVAAEANLYYIPAYLSLACLCKEKLDDTALTEELFTILKNISSFQDGKLHLSTLAETGPQQALTNCSLFKHPLAHKVIYISTSKNRLLGWNHKAKPKIIMAPYSSSAHLLPEYSLNENNLLKTNSLDQRTIQVLLADDDTKQTPSLLYSKIIDQFKIKPKESFENFTKRNKVESLQAIMLTVAESKQGGIIKWMQNSIFCLQQPGDFSPRKLFYDAIMSGCIPVIFKDNHKIDDYPFQSRLNYSSFTYTIPSELINANQNIIEILESVSENMRQCLFKNVIKVAHWLQYSLPDNNTHAMQYDALTLIIEELKKI